ncbi:DoxX family protein [Nocardia terpenica]|uniref:DoxX family protein n=1 Tax=Nocardia terpenica TaxID=455432 RepID=UPI001EECD210|nr:DoxX family protein [Nocardia terpenica]
MSTAEADLEREDSDRAPRWPVGTRVVFRFCVVYFGLFCLLVPQIIFAFAGWFGSWLPTDVRLWQMKVFGPIYKWVGRKLFGVDAVMQQSGSGDQTVVWVMLFCVFVVAVVAAVVWTVFDRRRAEYRALAGWFLLFIRLCVVGQLLTYGMAKLIPTQMPSPALATMLEPYGDFTPMAVLWSQVGSSQPYEMLLGAAELLGGLLLLIPRTAVAGALLCLVDMAQVFVLNMTFDVPVKILSGHLMAMSLLLLAPEARRLTNALLLGRATAASTYPEPFRTTRSRRIAAAVQVALGVWLLVVLTHAGVTVWEQRGDGRPKPPLYGIWNVSEFTRDGQPVPPLLTDQTRWRRIVFDVPGFAQLQRMDDTFAFAESTVDTGAHRLVLSPPPPKGAAQPRGAAAQPNPMATFTFQQPAPDRLELNGELNGHPVTVSLRRVDPDSFPLRSTGFHWIRDFPAN